jgi:hypothetical protein
MLDTVIVGAGPYGLSVAAHLRKHSRSFRIFGRLMDSWVSHMPKGMMLKSDGFASCISDPDHQFTLKQFCANRGIEYADTGLPVSLETFSSFGAAFAESVVPELENKLVMSIDSAPDGFLVKLDTGEEVTARKIVLAVGITHFENVPPELQSLPAELLSHSFAHSELEKFRNRNVIVIGGGSSAIDLAVLLHEVGAEVQLVARSTALKFHNRPTSGKRSLWQRIRNPQSGLGPGLKSRFYCDAPTLFRHLPERIRLETVRTHLGPSGGWFIKDRLIGHVPLVLGYGAERAEVRDGRACLHLRGVDGSSREAFGDHVIAATGFKVDVGRLQFLSAELRSKIKVLDSAPVLSSTFESSVSGLFFVGVAAANSFGPLMRFAFGADFAARSVSRALTKSASSNSAYVTVPTSAKEAKHGQSVKTGSACDMHASTEDSVS